MKVINNDTDAEVDEGPKVSRLEAWLVVGIAAAIVAAALVVIWIGG